VTSLRFWSLALALAAFGCSSSSGSNSTTTDASTDSSRADGATQDGTPGDDASANPNTGIACMTSSDCGMGLTCILPTDNNPVFGGGPPNGYCSKSCTMDTDCPGLNTLCLMNATGTVGACVTACPYGPPLMFINDPISNSPCMRDDVACTPVGPSVAACLPLCGEDSQCPAGRHCDPRDGVCVTTPHTGDPTGTPCDPNAALPTCAGGCLPLSASDGGLAAAFCTSSCVAGGDKPFTATPSCGGLTNGICFYVPFGGGAGDVGYCAPACTKQSDCLQFPTFVCAPFKGLTGVEAGVPNGFCVGGIPCPNGPSDCTNISGTTCVPTAHGPLCLNSGIPLGSEAPDGGVGDGGAFDAGVGDAGVGDGG
jgi:hypothetical protein